MTKANLTEGDVKKEIRALLEEHGWFTWMPPANTYGSHGQSDHLAVRKCGQGSLFMAVEAKLLKTEGSVNQKRFQGHLREHGCIAITVNLARLPDLAALLIEISLAFPHRYWHHPESSCVFLTAEAGEVDVGQANGSLVEEIDRAAYERLKVVYAGESAADQADKPKPRKGKPAFPSEVMEPGAPSPRFGDFGSKRETPPPGGETASTLVEQGATQDRSGEASIPGASKADKSGRGRTRTKADGSASRRDATNDGVEVSDLAAHLAARRAKTSGGRKPRK